MDLGKVFTSMAQPNQMERSIDIFGAGATRKIKQAEAMKDLGFNHVQGRASGYGDVNHDGVRDSYFRIGTENVWVNGADGTRIYSDETPKSLLMGNAPIKGLA